MQLLSIQVGKIQTQTYNGKDWTTAYFKQPVAGSVEVGVFNVQGDEQQHKKFHGGPHRAVLMYSAENYERWHEELNLPEELPYGAFAENFTVNGLDEATVCLGDTFQIGDTVCLQVAQPRQPCHQIYQALGIRGISQKAIQTSRTGWYLRVLQIGDVEAGMPIQLIERLHPDWTIERCHEVMRERASRPDAAAAMAAIEELEPSWRKRLQQAAAKAR